MENKTDFQILYDTHKIKVYRLCMGYLKGNEPLAVDMTQEVFIKVYEHWEGFKGKSSRSTWLYRIAVNTCLNQLRKEKKYQNISLDLVTEIPEETFTNQIKEPNFKELYRCINKLNTINRSIILLELEEMPQEEIADVMGLSHGAVRTRIARIKESLSKCIRYEEL